MNAQQLLKLRNELLGRYPRAATDQMKGALRVAYDLSIGVENRRTELTQRTELSDAGQLQELSRYVASTTRGGISDIRGRVQRARASLEARRANLKPKKPAADDPLAIAEAREIRDFLRGFSGGQFIATVLEGNRQMWEALLTSPVPFRDLTADVHARVLELYHGEEVIAAMANEEQAITLVEEALARAESVADSVARDAQSAAAPRPAAPVLSIRQGIG